MVALEASVLERASGAQQLLLILLCIYVTWKVIYPLRVRETATIICLHPIIRAHAHSQHRQVAPSGKQGGPIKYPPVLHLQVACARQRRALQAADARAAEAAAAAAAAVAGTSECFTAEWVNHLLRAVWPTSLEPKIAAKLRASLDASLSTLVSQRHAESLVQAEFIALPRMGGQKGAWIQKLQLELEQEPPPCCQQQWGLLGHLCLRDSTTCLLVRNARMLDPTKNLSLSCAGSLCEDPEGARP